MTDKPTGLELMRKPFEAHHISKLPKPTRAQTDAVKNDFKQGIRCDVCGKWHHPKVIHLDYVGHAALTDRLLDCDANWTWEPVAFDQNGAPLMDGNGGLWIKLTVCGMTRLGYGHPDGKKGGDAVKESIGDALRNAAMRFGAALDLWHKGDLHAISENSNENNERQDPQLTEAEQFWKNTHEDTKPEEYFENVGLEVQGCLTLDELKQVWTTHAKWLKYAVENKIYGEQMPQSRYDVIEMTKDDKKKILTNKKEKENEIE